MALTEMVSSLGYSAPPSSRASNSSNCPNIDRDLALLLQSFAHVGGSEHDERHSRAAAAAAGAAASNSSSSSNHNNMKMKIKNNINISSQSEMRVRPLDFHQDADPAEAARCAPAIEAVFRKALYLLTLFPNNEIIEQISGEFFYIISLPSLPSPSLPSFSPNPTTRTPHHHHTSLTMQTDPKPKTQL